MAPTVYLVSGATRGIGLAIVTQLAERDDVVIFAGARDTSKAASLEELQAKHPGKIHIVKLVSADKADAEAAAAKIKETAGKLDVVIANAGLNTSHLPPTEVSLEAVREHFDVNALGPLALFQATYPLLEAADEPKFAIISSILGSTTIGPRIPTEILPYGMSKAAANWLVSKLYYAYPKLVAIPVHPGHVATDLMAQGLKHASTELASKVPLITPQESATAVLKIIDSAKKDEGGLKFASYDGALLPW